MDGGLVERAADHAVGLGRKAHISNAVDECQAPRGNGIADFCLLGILLLDDLVVDGSAEVSVIVQHITSDAGTQHGVDPRHEDGLLAKRARHPAGKGRLAVGIAIPDRYAQGERHTVVAAAKERAVGGDGQCGLEFLLRLNHIVALVGTVIDHLLQADEQLVVLGNVLGHGTRSKKQEARGKKQVLISFHGQE